MLVTCRNENHRVTVAKLAPSDAHPSHLRENNDVEKTALKTLLFRRDKKKLIIIYASKL